MSDTPKKLSRNYVAKNIGQSCFPTRFEHSYQEKLEEILDKEAVDDYSEFVLSDVGSSNINIED